eukprot:TRINITY_DN774_c1_g1_i1.p1 TRINITY_DN774_c1_g1~~TRINITY_DN774_c1_g1_i1.p1  ORF type:complete len:215 (+),score=40.10 TRINITY_DN774_c1_g1_i1:55-645(+)
MDHTAPDPEDIGRSGWTVLHTMAAAYPQRPTEEQKDRMWGFLNGWSHLYPCTHCAAHMRLDMKKHPPQVDSKEDLNIWVCKLHNKVNDVLGKDKFPCELDKLLQRWHPTYPEIEGTEQRGGVGDLPPRRGSKVQPPSGNTSTGGWFGFGSKKTSPQSSTDTTTSSSVADDPAIQSLMDMTCTAFCPKDSKSTLEAA